MVGVRGSVREHAMSAISDAEVTDAPARTGTTDALTRSLRRLHEHWRATDDRQARVDLAVAATLVAHAALDALLPDQTRGRRVRDSWRDGSVLVRAARVTARLDQLLPQDLETLCAVRHSLGRSGAGPATAESRAWLEGDGVARAVALVDSFERLCRDGPR